MSFKVVVRLVDIDFEEMFENERDALAQAKAWRAAGVGEVFIMRLGKTRAESKSST